MPPKKGIQALTSPRSWFGILAARCCGQAKREHMEQEAEDRALKKQLARLEKMKAEGILTQEEYDAKRKEVIKKL